MNQEFSQELSLQIFLDHLRNATVLLRPDGLVLAQNALFTGLFRREIGVADSSTIFDLLKNNPPLIEKIKNVIETRGSYYLREMLVHLESKNPKFLDVETFPMIGARGNLIAVALIFYDRSGVAQFEEHQKRIDRINYLSTIASGLAHEIKNPLSGIKGASQLLASELKDQKDLGELAHIIQKEVIRVDQLLKDLLQMTKPKIRQKSQVNVNHILHDLLQLQKTVANASVQFVEEFDPSLPLITADPQALSQVFLNLIKNARQSIKGEGRVAARTRVVTDFGFKTKEKKRQVISIDIEDTGTGIDPEALERIFVPFYTTKAEGTGLGLPLCHQIVEEHEGDIQIKSEKGKGTIFSVYLPV